MRKSNITQVLKTFSVTPQDIPLKATNPQSENFFHLDMNKGIQFKIANTLEERKKAYQLLYKIYIEKEFAKPNASKMWYSNHDKQIETTTIIAIEDKEVVAAITVTSDSNHGLPADSIFHQELNSFRQKNQKPSEITSLGIDKKIRGANKILIKLFNLAYLVAREIHLASDLIITINPRHDFFYRKKLRFSAFGESKEYGKVCDAKAVLLTLNLASIEQFRKSIKSKKESKTSIYQFFYTSDELEHVVTKLKHENKSMSLKEIAYFFAKNPKKFMPSIKNILV